MFIDGQIKFAVIGKSVVHRIIREDIEGCFSVVRDAYLAHDAGRTVNPQSVFLRFPHRPGCRIIGLPAHFIDNSVSGIKWIASYPENRKMNLPRASALLILNDGETGFPFACLEASAISAVRTAVSAVLALDKMTCGNRVIDSLGVVGGGLISRHVLTFMFKIGFIVETVNLYDIDENSVSGFENWLAKRSPRTKVNRAISAGDACSSSEVIIFATVAGEPHVSEPDCFTHCPVVLHLSLRDLSPEIVIGSNNVVDDEGHAVTAGTSLERAAMMSGNTDFITCTLSDLLLGREALPVGKPSIFSPFGLGMLDVAMGNWIYQRATDGESCEVFDDFFVADEI